MLLNKLLIIVTNTYILIPSRIYLLYHLLSNLVRIVVFHYPEIRIDG